MLVVDDDASLRLLCRINLEHEGYTVLEAASLRQAEEQLASAPVALVLLDVHVGPESGLELMRSLRQRGSSPAVVLLSGSAQLDSDVQAEADRIILKPFRLEDLVGAVRGLVHA